MYDFLEEDAEGEGEDEDDANILDLAMSPTALVDACPGDVDVNEMIHGCGSEPWQNLLLPINANSGEEASAAYPEFPSLIPDNVSDFNNTIIAIFRNRVLEAVGSFILSVSRAAHASCYRC